jgi:hypothetical protein
MPLTDKAVDRFKWLYHLVDWFLQNSQVFITDEQWSTGSFGMPKELTSST